MKLTKDKVFSDSNVLLYLVREFADKKGKAIAILENNPIISVQVINENINICMKKFGLTDEVVRKHTSTLFNRCNVKSLYRTTIELAIDIKIKYKFSYYDSLIIASALENDCSILYSEDMQHNQLIENKLRIVNPFV